MADAGKPVTIAVLVKQVPDTNALKIDRASGKPVLGGQQVVNSYDEYAVEEALRLKELLGGEVVALTVGPAGAKDVLTRALAMGADRAIHVEVADPNALDTLAVARMLAEHLRPLAADLVLAGQVADDYETGQVGAQVAELLDLPLLSSVVGIEMLDGEVRARRDMEDGYQTVRAPMPAVLLTSTGLNEPRFPSLKGIMAAKKKPIERVAGEAVPRDGIAWSEPTVPPRTAGGVRLQDVPTDQAVKQLVSWLEEQKVL